MKNIIIIAYYFPPLNSSGIHRTIGFVKYLSSKGWNITILTLNKTEHCKDNKGKNYKLPVGVKIVRAIELDYFKLWDRIKGKSKYKNTVKVKKNINEKNLKESNKNHGNLLNQISGIFKIPDSQSGWFLPALLKTFVLKKPHVIYSSAPPFTGHLLGLILKYRWNVPLVTDFRDPWRGNPFRSSIRGIPEKIDKILEEAVLRASDRIIANTEHMKKLFKVSYPFVSNKIKTINNGYDPDDFLNIEEVRNVKTEKLLLVHPGGLYGNRNPMNFLYSIRELIDEHRVEEICIYLIGNSEKFEGFSIDEHVSKLKLDKYIKIMKPMTHKKILSIMKGADALILFSQGTKIQVPAKVFEYIGINKPIFAIVEESSATSQILKNIGKTQYLTLNSKVEIKKVLWKIYSEWRQNRLEDFDYMVKNNYTREQLANKLIKILNSVI